MRAKQKNKTNYVDALQDEHLYAEANIREMVTTLLSWASDTRLRADIGSACRAQASAS